MNDTKWINPHQPQTLYVGVILCYIQAVFALLSIGVLGGLALIITVALGGGGFGVANEKKWGYALAVAGAVLEVMVVVFYGALASVQGIISLGFDVALVVLLLHPMSRTYQRIWFK